MVSSMVVDELIRLEEVALMVFDGEEASSTVFDEQIRLEEASSTMSDCSNKGSGSSMAPAFSDFADEGLGFLTVSAFLTGSSGYAKFDLTRAATTVKPFADFARKDS
jgi:hypothetical protein